MADLELELALDEAIDRLNADGETTEELGGLVPLAAALRSLPADEWPDPAFPGRLAGALAAELAPRAPRAPRRRPRLSLRAGAGLAAAAAAALAVALVVVLGSSPSVSAATLAREALAASSGADLGPVRFTQVITNLVPSGTFVPAPPPPRIVEQVSFAAPDRWRVQATITEPHGEGTTTVLTVRNGDTIVAVRRSPDEGATETRRHAGADAALPTGADFGARIDPLTLLRQSKGRCGRSFSAVRDGPRVLGRSTLLLRVGATPCPSASAGATNGAASFVVDRRTHIVVEAKVHDSQGRLTQRLETRSLAVGGPLPAATFRLPPPLPKPPAPSGRIAFTPLLPHALPDGLRAGPITPVETQASTGKTIAFTVTYESAGGEPLLQLYEAAATTPSVRFPGRSVAIRPGLTGTYLDRNGMQILWWIEHGTYLSLQQGGVSAGVPLGGTYPLETLLRIARSVT